MTFPEPSCDLSVVVPVYRNRETVAELRRRVQVVCRENDLSHEVVFVNDACPEGSLAVLERLAEEVPQTVVLDLHENVGQHAAVLTGLAHCRGRWAVIMDADLQDPPEAIPRLLHAARKETAAVFAGRRGRYESSLRLLSSRLFKWVQHLACGVPRDAGIFVALRRDLVQQLVGDAHASAVDCGHDRLRRPQHDVDTGGKVMPPARDVGLQFVGKVEVGDPRIAVRYRTVDLSAVAALSAGPPSGRAATRWSGVAPLRSRR